MNQLEYVKKLLQLMEENPGVPVRIKAERDNCLTDDCKWTLLEFNGEPVLTTICEWNDRIYDDIYSMIEEMESDLSDDDEMSGEEIDAYIDVYIEKNKKNVFLLTVVWDGL